MIEQALNSNHKWRQDYYSATTLHQAKMDDKLFIGFDLSTQQVLGCKCCRVYHQVQD